MPGIYRVGAGLGPASAFLYSGPAINVMAIFLTARVLGYDLGIARLVGSVAFAVIIGLIMAAIFRKDEDKRTAAAMQLPEPPPAKRSLWQTSLFFVAMIGFLVFSDWANPSQTIIHKKDGTRMQVAVMLETTDTLRVQIEEPVGKWKKGEKDDDRQGGHRTYGTSRSAELPVGGLGIRSSLVLCRRLFPGHAGDGRDVVRAGRAVRVDGSDLGLCQVDHSFAVRRRVGDGFCRVH